MHFKHPIDTILVINLFLLETLYYKGLEILNFYLSLHINNNTWEVCYLKSNILVLEATQSNYEELREIFFTVRKNTFHWIKPETLKLSDFDESTKDELILIALIENEIVGFISIWVPEKFIHNLFVLEGFQGRGVGTALVNEAIERVGLPLALKCVKSNTKAFNYYVSHNWKVEKEDMCSEGLYYLMKYYNE